MSGNVWPYRRQGGGGHVNDTSLTLAGHVPDCMAVSQVRYRLRVVNVGGSGDLAIPRQWWKDEGGKSKCITIQVSADD